jgi:rubrerythrin
MFTIADIRHIAIQIEKNGEETYRKAASEATDPDIGQILGKMADDEKRHAQWFENNEKWKLLVKPFSRKW